MARDCAQIAARVQRSRRKQLRIQAHRRRAKHQAPNRKFQRSSRIETPKTKLQTPKNSQVPSSKPRPALRAWSFSGVWCLVFDVWSLGLGGSLELGVWN